MRARVGTRRRVRAGGLLALVISGLVALPALAPGVPAAPALAATPAPSASSSTTPAVSATPVSPDERLDAVRAWVQGEGQRLVRASAGADTAVALSDPVPLNVWPAAGSPSTTAADTATPVAAGDAWALGVTVDGAAADALLVTYQAGEVSGRLVEDAEVSAAVARAADGGAALLVEDDDAWYEVADGTVTAVGAAARSELSGPVSLVAYTQVLRERRQGATPAAAEVASDEPTDWTAWATVLGVSLAAALIVALTIRHERRVMAPLHEPVAVPPGGGRRGTTAVPGAARADQGDGTQPPTGLGGADGDRAAGAHEAPSTAREAGDGATRA